METLVMVVHVLAAMGVIGLVLLQHGKGADMGAAFGSGASGSLFGVSGSSNFMSRATAIFVAIFFTTSLTLAYLSSHRGEQSSVISLQKKAAQNAAPAVQTQDETKPAEPSTAKDVPQ
ncbi:MAG: preprotein translocase subunit SecG [Methylophilus sp.]